MAKAQTKAPKKAEYKGYHNINLSKEDEALFVSWAEANDCGLEMVEYMVDAGYKVSFDYDHYHKGWRCGMYCTEQKMEWAGYTLTAWAVDLTTAWKLLNYKHIVMCGETWEVAKDKPERQHSAFG